MEQRRRRRALGFLVFLAIADGIATRAEDLSERQALLASVARLASLEQFVFMTDRFSFSPERSASEQLAAMIRLAERQPISLDGETIYGRYLLFDESVLRVFHENARDLDPVLDALRGRYVELVTREVSRFGPEALRGEAGHRNLDAIAKLLSARPEGESEGARALREVLERKYGALYDQELAAMALPEVERVIERFASIPARDLSLSVVIQLDRLGRRYLAAFGAWLRSEEEAGRIDLARGTGLTEAPRELLMRDMHRFNPYLALGLLERVLHGGPEGMYAVMLAPSPAERRARLEQIREADLPGSIASEIERARTAQDLLRTTLLSEQEHLYDLLGRTVLEEIVPILTNATTLGIELLRLPSVIDPRVLARVEAVIAGVDAKKDPGRVRERLRAPDASAALSQALHDALDGLLLDSAIGDPMKIAQTNRLAGALVVLQTKESKDGLLRIFEAAGKYRSGTDRVTYASIEGILVRSIVAYVTRTYEAGGSEQESAERSRTASRYAIVDRLMALLGGAVRFDRSSAEEQPALIGARVVQVLFELRSARLELMQEYIRWTYAGDESALAPVRCEAVVFHLADLCVDYARMGALPLPPEPRGMQRRTAERTRTKLPQEQLLELLSWIDGSLTGVPLPDVRPVELEDVQRVTLGKIYEGFAGQLRDRDPRYVEVLLDLARRLVRAADRDDIKRGIFAPFARILTRDHAITTVPFITPQMMASLETIWATMGQEGAPFADLAKYWP